MRLRLIPLLVLLLILSAQVAGAQGAVILEDYLPEDTDFYASIRLDDAYINTLDGLRARVIAHLDTTPVAEFIPPEVRAVSLPLLLDLGSQQIVRDDFENGIRSWLGNRAVLGAVNPEGALTAQWRGVMQLELFAIIEITNRERAESLINSRFAENVEPQIIEPDEPGGFTAYLTPQAPLSPQVLLNDDVLIFANMNGAERLLEGFRNTLTDSTVFNATMNMLPPADYNIVLYSDAGAALPRDGVENLLVANTVGHQAVGFTLADENTLVANVVLNLRNLDSLAEFGFTPPEIGTVDPAFLGVVPADVDLLIHGTDIQASVESVLDAVVTAEPSAEVEFNAQLEQVIGLNLRDDILSWLDGDFALVARLDALPGEPSLTTGFYYELEGITYGPGLSFAFVAETSDAAQSQQVVDALEQYLQEASVRDGDTVSREDVGGVEAVVYRIENTVDLSWPFRQPQYAEFITPSTQVIELVIAANDDLFVAGTRTIVAEVLSGEGGFDSSAGYTEAAMYLLPDANNVLYASDEGFALMSSSFLLGPTIGPIFTNVLNSLEGNVTPTPTPSPDELRAEVQAARAERAAQLEEMTRFDTMLREVLAIISSSSISSVTLDGEDAIIRLVLTLAE